MGLNEAFVALSDPIRREIIELLKKREMSAGEIAEHFDITAPAISYHLRKLKAGNLITEERVKTFIYYKFNPEAFTEVMRWMAPTPASLQELEDPASGGTDPKDR